MRLEFLKPGPGSMKPQCDVEECGDRIGSIVQVGEQIVEKMISLGRLALHPRSDSCE